MHQTAGGWSQYLAAKILSALEAVLTAKPVREMNGAMKDAFKKACDAAKVIEGFAAEHPLATAACVTIIAIGILVVLTPYVVEWLGFAELGPVEGELFSLILFLFFVFLGLPFSFFSLLFRMF